VSTVNPDPAAEAASQAPPAAARRFSPSEPQLPVGELAAARWLVDAYLEVRALTAAGDVWISSGQRRIPAPRRLVLLQLDREAAARLAALGRRLHAKAAAGEDAPEAEALLARVEHATAALPSHRVHWWLVSCVLAIALVAQAGIAALGAATGPGTSAAGAHTLREVLSNAGDLVGTLTGSVLSFDVKDLVNGLSDASNERLPVLVFVAIILLLAAWVVLRPYVWADRARRSLLAAEGIDALEARALGAPVRERPLGPVLGVIPVLPIAYLGLFMAGGLLTGSLHLQPGQSPAGAAVLAALLLGGASARLAVLAHRARGDHS
jgi:hypothetical protein